MDIFAQPYEIGGADCRISGSIGAKTLIGCADEAMYRAKKNGKNGYMIYGSHGTTEGESEL